MTTVHPSRARLRALIDDEHGGSASECAVLVALAAVALAFAVERFELDDAFRALPRLVRRMVNRADDVRARCPRRAGACPDREASERCGDAVTKRTSAPPPVGRMRPSARAPRRAPHRRAPMNRPVNLVIAALLMTGIGAAYFGAHYLAVHRPTAPAAVIAPVASQSQDASAN